MKNIVKHILVKTGPCLSSDLALRIKYAQPDKSPEAIRKMISRCSEISRLGLVNFSHNRRFVYLRDDFGSPVFWRALERVLRENSSAYSSAILAVMNNGGFLKYSDFGIVSGSPIRLSKHLSYEVILKNLVDARIFRIESFGNLGKIILINNNSVNDPSAKALAKSYDFFQRPVIELIKSWLRNIGLAAFNQIKTKCDGDGNPVVGSFEWCITAPSYVYPLSNTANGEVVPGFIVCDYFIRYDASVPDSDFVTAFLNKVKMTRVSRPNQRIMFVLFSRKFSAESFRRLRAEGVLPVTIANAFGCKLDACLVNFANIISDVSSIDKDPDELINMVDEFDNLLGENNNLRGSVFELFVTSQIERIFGKGLSSTNEIYKSSAGEAEVDVVFDSFKDMYFIECKNVSLLDSKEVTDWIRKRIPRVNKSEQISMILRSGNGKKIHHHLWVTGDVKASDINKINKFSADCKKFEVKCFFGDSLEMFFKDSDRGVFDLYKKAIKKKTKTSKIKRQKELEELQELERDIPF